MDKTFDQQVEESVVLCSAPITELECQYCWKKFFSEQELREHYERRHFGEDKPLRCGVCGVGIASKACMRQHMLIHSDTRPWQCSVCSERFRTRSNLVCHKRIHDGDKPFKCDICRQRFGLKKNMEEHRVTHTNEKLFQCRQCGKKFARRSTLVRHMRTHTDLRPFECAHCERKFARRYDLQRHLFRIHLKETKVTKNEKAAEEADKSQSNLLEDHQIKIEEVQIAIATVVVNDDDYVELLDESEDITKEILPVPVELINDNNGLLQENVVVSTSSSENHDGNNNNFGDYIQRELSAFSPLRQLQLKEIISEFITDAKKM